MRKNVLKSSLAGFCIKASVFGMLMGASNLHALATPPAPTSPAALDECSKDLLLSYFPEKFVNDALKRFNIPEDKWAGINAELSSKDKEIVALVEKKAASINPNPLKDPQQRQIAVKLFRETLLQVFTDALKKNGIEDTENFQLMLDDIQQQKAKKFAQCIEKQRGQEAASIAADSSHANNKDAATDDADDADDSDEDDGDDEDDDEDDDENSEDTDKRKD